MKFAKSEASRRTVYTIPEIAELLGVNLTRAYELARTVNFPVVQISKKRLIVPKQAFDRWLESAVKKE
jgi:excisionase family DNA binding protein